jgi:hypothetical protein
VIVSASRWNRAGAMDDFATRRLSSVVIQANMFVSVMTIVGRDGPEVQQRIKDPVARLDPRSRGVQTVSEPSGRLLRRPAVAW